MMRLGAMRVGVVGRGRWRLRWVRDKCDCKCKKRILHGNTIDTIRVVKQRVSDVLFALEKSAELVWFCPPPGLFCEPGHGGKALAAASISFPLHHASSFHHRAVLL